MYIMYILLFQLDNAKYFSVKLLHLVELPLILCANTFVLIYTF